MANIYIGTSGWQYEHWRGVFYPHDLPQKEWLRYYTKYFDTVEINATFYHQMKKEIFEKWRKTVGPNFIFSFKASRFMTHIKRLNNCQEEVKRFFEVASSQSGVKGALEKGKPRLPKRNSNVVLWQLPPRMVFDELRLKKFLPLLPKSFRQAFEFRHQSWFNDKVFKLLRRYNAAVVFQDYPEWPKTEEVTADFVYLRFHGKEHLYASGYSRRELDEWAKKMKQWFKKEIDVYGYFNNDSQGYAVDNARTLKNLLGLK